MQDFLPDVQNVISYFQRFSPFKRGGLLKINNYITETFDENQKAAHFKNLLDTNRSKVNNICKEFGVEGHDNIGLIFLFLALHNNKEERNEAREDVKEYWLQLKSIVEELSDYKLPHFLDEDPKSHNPFYKITFHRRFDDPISITNPSLIFNFIQALLPYLKNQVEHPSFEEKLKEIESHHGTQNAPDGYRITSNKLIFSINDYLTKEEPHLSQYKRSTVIKELFSLTDYPLAISLRSIGKTIYRDK